MGGKSGGGGGDTTIKFAPYIEAAHSAMLNNSGTVPLSLSVFTALNSAFNASPYGTVPVIDPDSGYLGDLSIQSYPALFDMFNQKLFGLNVNELWEDSYNRTVNGALISRAVQAQSDLIQDELDTTVIPKLKTGFRDINAVQSSSFVIAKGLIGKAKVRILADFSSKLQLHQFDMAHARWEGTLNWNKAITAAYGDAMKMYYSARFDADNRQMEFKVKDTLWNLSLFEYGRAMVAALNGAAAAKPDLQPSQAAKSISMAAAGAGAGASLGSMIKDGSGGSYAGLGAAAGGVLGLAGSFA